MLESVSRMRKLLRLPARERDSVWARKLCEAARDVHIDVWENCLLNTYVERCVVSLFLKSDSALQKLNRSTARVGKGDEIAVYLRNNSLRLENIRDNYLHGRLSSFPPDSKLSIIRARAS